MIGSIKKRAGTRINRWASRRHGTQTSPLHLPRNRIYILPTKAGMVFGIMLFTILLGSMNYNNSMGLTLAFALGSFMFVAMHHCHRSLLGLQISYAEPKSVFAGQQAYIPVTLTNLHAHRRVDLTLGLDEINLDAVNLNPDSSRTLDIAHRTTARGRHEFTRLRISCRYPCGLFDAWTWVYWNNHIVVYPKPAGTLQPPPAAGQDAGDTAIPLQGDDEFAELRKYQHGDNLARVAWKALARSQTLHTKMFETHTTEQAWFDWAVTPGDTIEERLSQLSRWIVDAASSNQSFGLRLPHLEIPPNTGAEHTQRCLTSLALF